MKTIQILGTGCAKCRALSERAEQAVQETGVHAVVVKVTDLAKISALGVMTTPALAVDGVLKFSGRVPGLDEVKAAIQ